MARQLVLNAPAGIVFIRRLVNRSLDYGHYTIVIAEFFDREGTRSTRADFGERMGGFQPLKFAFLFAGSERTYVPSPTELHERARLFQPCRNNPQHLSFRPEQDHSLGRMILRSGGTCFARVDPALSTVEGWGQHQASNCRQERVGQLGLFLFFVGLQTSPLFPLRE